MESKELQDRREFFKQAAKKALPLLGIIVGTGLFSACEDDDNYYSESNGGGGTSGCGGKCYSGCTGTCKSGCKTNCVGGSCKEMCIHSCKGTFLKVNNPVDNGTISK